MGLFNWGSLPKAQDDAQTIDEAIASAITAHEEDPTAHLGDGESLEQHKTNEIVDHPAYSVVRDKIQFDRNQIDFYFTSLDGAQKSAGVSLDGLNSATMQTTGVTNNEQTLEFYVGDNNQGVALAEKNPNFEAQANFPYLTNITAFLGAFWFGEPMGFGFKIVDGTAYAMYYDSDGTEHTQSLGTITTHTYHTFRCELVDGVSLKFYIDGEMLYDFGNVAMSDNYFYIAYSVKQTSASMRFMYLREFHWDADK